MSVYDHEENAIVNNAGGISETPSNLVGKGEGKELSPNPEGFGFTKQLIVDSLPDSGQLVNTLYLLTVKNNGVLVGYKKYKWTPTDGYVFVGVTPDLKLENGPREQKAVEVNTPKVLYDKNGLPVVSYDDEGDVLQVKNGIWQKATISGGTKLYQHKLKLTTTLSIGGETITKVYIECLSTKSTALINTDLGSAILNTNGDNYVTYQGSKSFVPLKLHYSYGPYLISFMLLEAIGTADVGHICYEQYASITIASDTVTEL